MRRAATFRAYSTSKPLSTNWEAFFPGRKVDQDAPTDSSVDPRGPEFEEHETVDPDKNYETQASKHHSNRSFVSPRPALPLSPLMDPAYQAAKQKYTQPKARPSKILTPFQERLARNPYAKAIATPVRRCALTRVHLPSFFLIDFELINHPTTSEPWYLPRSLSSPKPSSVTADVDAALQIPSPTTESTFSSEEDSLPSPNYEKESQPTSLTPHVPLKVLATQGSRYGPRTYVLSRASLLLATVTLRSGFTKAWKDFAVPRFEAWRIAPPSRKIYWRKDIDMFVLKLLRKRLVDGLKKMCNRYAWCLVACEKGWTSVGDGGKKQLGAVMWLGKEGTDPDPVPGASRQRDEVLQTIKEQEGDDPGVKGGGDLREQEGTSLEELEQERQSEAKENWKSESLGVPGEFATIERKEGGRTKLPIYNMQALLGEDHIRDLRAFKPDLFGGELVAIKSRKQTIDIQLQLWKIQGYIAKYEEQV